MISNHFKVLYPLVVFLFLIGCKQPPAEKDFTPFAHSQTIEELRDNQSIPFLKMAATDMAILDSVNRTGTYQGTLESINEHSTP